MSLRRIKLWDLPVRIFHWLLVILVVAAVITAKLGGNAMNWHGRIGVAILALLVFRLVWGFIGSHYARFASFWPRPSSVCAYLHGNWHGIGHNPLGAISVLALFALIGLQVMTGLFGNDDIAFTGPLFSLVSKEFSDTLTGIHKLSIDILLGLIALHLGAVAFYVLIKKEDLLKPMITGWKDVEPAQEPETASAKTTGIIALVVALAIAVAAAYGGSGIWLPHPVSNRPATVPAAQNW